VNSLDFEAVPLKRQRGAPNTYSYVTFPAGWRWMDYGELRPIQDLAQRSYVVRPYSRRRGQLESIATPVDGGLRVATATIQRWVPYPHAFFALLNPRRAWWIRVLRAANDVLPTVVPWRFSIGTAAIVDSGQPLPSLDLLPEPMRWEIPLRVPGRRALPWLPAQYGVERNVPSGAALRPVTGLGEDGRYFAPLAADPDEARAVLSPALLKLTRQRGVAWWSDGTTLFAWTHEPLPVPRLQHLAESAELIHRHLVD
jgi:hypothetical protein